MRLRVILFLGMILTVSGCGKRQVVYNQPALPTGGHWDIAWIDPEIVMSDTLFTLMRSNRIDSVYIEHPDPFAGVVPSLRFEVTDPDCPVAISLFDSRMHLVKPLVLEQLPAGLYKLTFQSERWIDYPKGETDFVLSADVCSRSFKTPFVKD